MQTIDEVKEKMKTNEEGVTVWGIHCTIEEESMFHKDSVMAVGCN